MYFEDLTVYAVENWTLEDRINLYQTEILANCRCSEVDEAFINYITDNIEPVGWKAVWKPTKVTSGLSPKFDYLVEVLDVSQFKLEARINVLNPLITNNNVRGGDEKNLKKLPLSINVPILELFSVHDESSNGQFDKTAEIVEHVRFFYQNIWRPWDSDDDEDCIFVNHYLEPRMKLYYELVEGVIPSVIVHRIQCILQTSWENYYRLDSLEKTMQVSDSEVELDEKDVFNCMEIRLKMEELKRELQILENPTFRAIMVKKNLSLNNLPRGRRQDSEVVLHMVTDKLFAGMLRDLPSSTIVEHHSLFSSAVSAIYENDTIWLFPGVYTCDGLGWFDDSITIEGRGTKPEDVVIKVSGNTDIFMNCNAQDLKISNVTIEATSNQFSTLMVHRGCTTLKNCIIKGGQVGVYSNSYAEAVLYGCRIVGTELCGVNAQAFCSVTVKECEFYGFGYCAVAIQHSDESTDRSVKLYKNRLSGVGKFGFIFYSENQEVRELTMFRLKTKGNEELRYGKYFI
ncbi:Shc SH2-domain binding protein, variant 2 [Chamberlinius hualienensis]